MTWTCVSSVSGIVWGHKNCVHTINNQSAKVNIFSVYECAFFGGVGGMQYWESGRKSMYNNETICWHCKSVGIKHVIYYSSNKKRKIHCLRICKQDLSIIKKVGLL